MPRGITTAMAARAGFGLALAVTDLLFLEAFAFFAGAALDFFTAATEQPFSNCFAACARRPSNARPYAYPRRLPPRGGITNLNLRACPPAHRHHFSQGAYYRM